MSSQAQYIIIMSNNGGTVPAVTFTIDGLPLNAAAAIAPLANNVFQLSVSTDPLSDQNVADIVITATGPGGMQQIDVSLQTDASN